MKKSLNYSILLITLYYFISFKRNPFQKETLNFIFQQSIVKKMMTKKGEKKTSRRKKLVEVFKNISLEPEERIKTVTVLNDRIVILKDDGSVETLLNEFKLEI